ncbi:hypothetical protein ABH926_007387 [Catenulispora sp. GP43]|uniref:hypothetical protein n=1 Tax=Catenulispora sp. GP43 TaxID=3156263 RepID=UPI003513A290
MPTYDPNQIANLVGQLGGDHQQAAQRLQGMGGQIDPRQHADTLQQMGIDPRKLQDGDYQQHLDAQDQPGFQGYRSGDMSEQTPQFGERSGQDQTDEDDEIPNFQQFDQGQAGMRGMEPHPDPQMADDQQMVGRRRPRKSRESQQDQRPIQDQ